MPLPGFNWDDIRYLLACWRAGSLAGAGRLLGVDQTTAGRRLAALEEGLGARLFDRTPDGFVLTATGEQLIEIAEGIEQGAIDLERMATGRDSRLEGVVRLATTETMSTVFLVRRLASFHRAHPGIQLEVISGMSSVNLLKREADLALRAGARPTQQSLVVRKVGAAAMGFYASDAYLARRGDRRPPTSLDGEEVVTFCDELGQVSLARWVEKHEATTRIVLRVNSFKAAAEAARGGWGIAGIPRYVGESYPSLRRLDIPAPEPTDLWLAVHADLQRTPRVRAVMEHVLVAVNEEGMGLRRGGGKGALS